MSPRSARGIPADPFPNDLANPFSDFLLSFYGTFTGPDPSGLTGLYELAEGQVVDFLKNDYGLATAGALIQGASLNLGTGAVSLKCGAPGRSSLQSAVGRYAAAGKDNFVQL